MRPVNLLPSDHRPRRASGELSGSAYAVVGVLAVFLVMALGYVVTSNQVTSRKDEATKAQADAKVAEAKVASLAAFGDFSQQAATRSASVQSLAAGRFDWERLAREVGRVLPKDTWLTEVDATTRPDDPTTGGDAAEAISGPSAKIAGCAKKQTDVAKLLVRLRRMHRAEDVKLKDSSRGDTSSSSAASSAGAAEGCGKHLTFDVTVVFKEITAPEAGSRRVPTSLGGGS